MFQELYEKLDKKRKSQIFELIVKDLAPVVLDEENCSIISCPVDFYPEHALYEIVDNNVMPPMRRFYVISDDFKKVLPVEYSRESIHALNEDCGLYLTEDNIRSYLKFFFNFSRGRHGRFLVLDGVDDIQWQEDPPLAARRAISSMITPIELFNVDTDNNFACSACFVFKDSLVKADVKIKQNGQIEIHNEEILVEDMPIIDDSFAA
ncbi:MAG: hypothetical protein VX740_09815 [Pseudomonadota bacterium]|jgi:hypothetical protein|nr:hypothetical protein [Pseudomonadota bacterium]MED5423720.1 hypothetical protein [Pseudomonadota bacterium]